MWKGVSAWQNQAEDLYSIKLWILYVLGVDFSLHNVKTFSLS